MHLIFVPGALVRDAAWWWQPTADLLRERTGIHSIALELPSIGSAAGLAEDAAALRAALDGVDSANVVGHSYGGTVIADAGQHPAVRHLLYISSYLPDVGQAQGAIMSGEPDPVAVAPNDDGTLGVVGYDAASFGARFLQDAAVGIQQQAFERVTTQGTAAFTTRTTAAGWAGVDSTYLVAAHDRSTSLELQRWHAARATRSAELPTGHHPFITRPDLVVEQIERMLP